MTSDPDEPLGVAFQAAGGGGFSDGYISVWGTAGAANGVPDRAVFGTPADQQPGTDIVLDPDDASLIAVAAGTYLVQPAVRFAGSGVTSGSVEPTADSGAMVIPYDGTVAIYTPVPTPTGIHFAPALMLVMFSAAGKLAFDLKGVGGTWTAELGVDIVRIA